MLLLSCATQRPPEGGPVDTEAPYIVDSRPETGTVRYDKAEVTLRFNEYVDRSSFEQSVHVSPLPSRPPEYKWSRRAVTIRFPDDLVENTTYVVTVGSNVRDRRAGNLMESTWQLAFSTGDEIDGGMLGGVVFDDSPTGITLFAYDLERHGADTLNPSTIRPDYAVQTDATGRFTFSYLRSSLYRVFAVRDKFNNMVYDIEVDDIGIPHSDVFAADSLADTPMRFRLVKQDTTAPYIQRIEALTSRHLRVTLSEDILPAPPPPELISLRDSVTRHAVSILTVVKAEQGRFSWDVYLTEDIKEGRYVFEMDSIQDVAGNALRHGSIVFAGTAIADTGRASLRTSIPQRGARDHATDSAFVFRFSRPVHAEADVFSLQDSSDVDVRLDVAWADMTRVVLQHPVLAEQAAHTLSIDLSAVVDAVTGRASADSTYTISFTTGKAGPFGSISGNVNVEEQSGTAHVILRELKDGGERRSTAADSSGAFAFPRVREGTYKLEAFIDLDGNERFSPGTAFPFSPPEPFVFYKDTLRVRARWDTDGVILKFP